MTSDAFASMMSCNSAAMRKVATHVTVSPTKLKLEVVPNNTVAKMALSLRPVKAYRDDKRWNSTLTALQIITIAPTIDTS